VRSPAPRRTGRRRSARTGRRRGRAGRSGVRGGIGTIPRSPRRGDSPAAPARVLLVYCEVSGARKRFPLQKPRNRRMRAAPDSAIAGIRAAAAHRDRFCGRFRPAACSTGGQVTRWARAGPCAVFGAAFCVQATRRPAGAKAAQRTRPAPAAPEIKTQAGVAAGGWFPEGCWVWGGVKVPAGEFKGAGTPAVAACGRFPEGSWVWDGGARWGVREGGIAGGGAVRFEWG